MFLKKVMSSAVLVASFATLVAPMATQAAVKGEFSPGDLIRGTTTNTVYYFGPDGRRYVFPNEKTYFTWYQDFSKVKFITDGQLGAMPLGRSNVTYKPGYKMVKITTDPKVYAVDQGGVLRWVKTQQLAETLFGLNWKNRIDDVPDSFFVNYRVGAPLETANEYNPANVMTGTPTISIDKQFDETMLNVAIAQSNIGFVPASTTIKAGTTVTWTNNDSVPHSVTGTGFDSGLIQPGKSYTHKFSQVGSFEYRCSIHPTMQGAINVVP